MYADPRSPETTSKSSSFDPFLNVNLLLSIVPIHVTDNISPLLEEVVSPPIKSTP